MKNNSKLASWIFGSISFVFLLGVFVFAPPELPAFKLNLLAIISSLMMGPFGFFLTGFLNLQTTGNVPHLGKVALRAGGGVALFLVTLWFWHSEISPIKEDKGKPREAINSARRVAQQTLAQVGAVRFLGSGAYAFKHQQALQLLRLIGSIEADLRQGFTIKNNQKVNFLPTDRDKLFKKRNQGYESLEKDYPMVLEDWQAAITAIDMTV